MASDLARKQTYSKTCAICRAPARSNNFGAVTCDACKSFFRRANRGASYKTFRCVDGNACVVDIDGRKSCSFCRYQTCLKVGMDITKGKSDQEKAQLLAKQRTKKVNKVRDRQDNLEMAAQELFNELQSLTYSYRPSVALKTKVFTMMELFDLDTLNVKYSHSFYKEPVRGHSFTKSLSPVEQWLYIVAGLEERLCLFTNSIVHFMSLKASDRNRLYTSAVSELCLISAVLTYDSHRSWFYSAETEAGRRMCRDVPPLKNDLLKDLFESTVLQKEIVKVTRDLLHYHPDQTIIILLFTLLLFTPTRPGLIEVESVRQSQNYYGLLLRKYLAWRFGTAQGNIVFYELAALLKQFRRIGPSMFPKTHGRVMQNHKYKALLYP